MEVNTSTYYNMEDVGMLPRTKMHTANQAAEVLNVSVHTIRAWIAQRRLGCVRLGRAIRIPEAEIQKMLERGAVPARPERR